MTDASQSKPGNIVPPPVVYLAYFVATLLIDWRRPAPLLPTWPQYAVGALLIAVGVLIGVAMVREFRRARTPVQVHKSATALVTTGIFRYSRNPAYVGVTLVYVGAAVMVDSLWILLGVLPAIYWTHRKAILREEEHLQELFGQDYAAYKHAVRRWI